MTNAEKRATKKQAKRMAWARLKWQHCQKWHLHGSAIVAKLDGFRVTVAPSPAGVGFEIFILDKMTGGRQESRRIYLDRDEARLVAFDEMQAAERLRERADRPEFTPTLSELHLVPAHTRAENEE